MFCDFNRFNLKIINKDKSVCYFNDEVLFVYLFDVFFI